MAVYVAAPPISSSPSSASSSPVAPSSVSSSTLSSAASSSAARFPYGGGVFDTSGNLLIADQLNNRVIEVDPLNNGLVWSFGSGNGSLCNPGPGSIIGPNDAERLAGGLTLMVGSGIPTGVAGTVPCMDNRVIIVNQQGSITWQYGQAGVDRVRTGSARYAGLRRPASKPGHRNSRSGERQGHRGELHEADSLVVWACLGARVRCKARTASSS